MAIDWRVRETVQSGDSATTEWVSHRVYHINKDGHYVHELKYGDTIAWEEYCGTYARGTLPTGVASLSCTRTTKEPSASGGAVSDGTELFNGDVLSFTATASAYWSASMTHSSYAVESYPDNLAREHTYTGVTMSGVSAARAERAVTYTQNEHITQTVISYTDLSGSAASVTKTSSGSVSGVWQGASISWTPTAEIYWTAPTGTVSAGTSFNISPTASRAKRTVLVVKDSHVNSIIVSYTNTSGTDTSTTFNSSGSLSDAWQGASISWNPTTDAYWTASSGSAAAGTSSLSISPTISRTMRTITFTKNAGIASVSITYTNSSGVSTSATRTSTSTISAWDGAAVTWTATTESGYVTSQESGSFGAGSGNQTIAPTAVAIRTLKAIQGDGALSGPVFNVYRQSSPSGLGAAGLLITGASGATETETVYDGDVLYVAITNPTIYGNNYYPTGNFVVSGDLKMKSALLSTGNRPSTAYSNSYSDSEALSSDMTKVHYASTNSNMNSVISPTSFTVADGDKVTLAYTTGSFGGRIIHMLVLGYAYAEDSGDTGQSIDANNGGSFTLHNGIVLTLEPDYQGNAGVSYTLSDGSDNIACLVSPYDMTETWNQTSSDTLQALFEEYPPSERNPGIEDIAYQHGCVDAQILMWIGCGFYESGFGGSVDAEQMMEEYGQPDAIIYYTANGETWTLLEDNT